MSCTRFAWLEQVLPIRLQLPNLCYFCARQNVGIVDLGSVLLEDICEGIFYSYEFNIFFLAKNLAAAR